MIEEANSQPWATRVVELMCSRLCHDLAGPVGAIRNGVELIEEMGGEIGDDALGLIGHSAEQASRRLALYRLAYGLAGTTSPRAIEEARAAAANWANGSRVTLDWPPGRPPSLLGERPGLAKMLLNLVMLADEMLPQGGTIAVDGEGNDTVGRLNVTADGHACRLTPDSRAALDGAVATSGLTPRTVHAFATGRFAAHFTMGLTISPENRRPVILSIHWPV
ncbi:MAG: hypothetical protein GC191_11635 [Azospirillum sp.]|nr:hypothetical protein [Azospirillum sp.]